MADAKLTRIGIFYDGSYFAHVSDYYLYHHERRARVRIQGMHALIRDEVAKREQTDSRYCQIVEAHYFRGRFSADDARRHDAQRQGQEGDTLYRERKFEDALIKAGVTPHFMPVFAPDDGRPPREKGIDVWLALEAFDLSRSKGLNVVVLVTGDGDYVPLVRKLNALGTRVMVTAWDLSVEGAGTTRAAQALIDEVTHPVMMGAIIDDRARRTDPLVVNLFVPRPPPAGVGDDAPAGHPDPEGEDRGLPPRPYNRPRFQPGDASEQRAQGWVANIPYGREFGFIEPANGAERLFFHQTWVVNCSFAELQQGDRVEFTPEANPRDGRPVARRVTRLPPMPDVDEEEEDAMPEEDEDDIQPMV